MNPSISIKGSLSGLVKEEEKVPEEAEDTGPPAEEDNAAEVRPEDILAAWKQYSESIKKSRPRVYATLESNVPQVEGAGLILLRLNSDAQKDNFDRNIKSELIRHIRKQTGVVQLDIQTEIEQKESNGKKIYTDQDRMNYLIKKNPELANLKSHFNLDFDH